MRSHLSCRFPASATGIILLLTCHLASAASQFFDDFESYTTGAAISGLGGWSGSGPSIPIATGSSLPTSYLEGKNQGQGSDQAFASHAIPGLVTGTESILSFVGRAYVNSNNSWAGLSSSPAGALKNAVIWDYLSGSNQGWQLEVRSESLAPQAAVVGIVAGNPISFAIHFDRTANEVWGTYDTGAGMQSTRRFSYSSTAFDTLAFINVSADLRGTDGIAVDNFSLTTPVPEPSQAIMLLAGLALAGALARKPRSLA